MNSYLYAAATPTGQRIEGRAWAASELELDRSLEGQGLTLTRARVVSTERRARKLRMPSDELIAFTTQLATVTGAGVRIVEGLEGIGSRMRHEQSRLLVEELLGALNAGSPLSEAMDRHPASFPPVYRATVRAGETSGALDVVLSKLARFLEWSRAMRATAIQALIYPMILFWALLGLVLVLLYWVLPRIIGMFPGGREDLPRETRALLAISDFISSNWIALLVGAGLALAGYLACRRSDRGRAALHGIVLRTPKLGTIAAKLATSRFAGTASILQSAGCDVFTVLGVAGETCGNGAMAAAFRRTADRVRRGRSISDSLEEEPQVDALLKQMVAVGERAGDLDGCLARVTEYYDEEVPRAVKRFLAFLEPAMLVVAGAVVAFILLASIMPIFALYESL